MIKEICNEVDICIEKRVLSKKLVNLICDFLKEIREPNTKELDMVLSLDNEIDMFIAGRLTNESKFDEQSFVLLPAPSWLIDFFVETKKENVKFWNTNRIK